MAYALTGTLVLDNAVLQDGAVIVENGKIIYVGKRSEAVLPTDVRDCGTNLIAPGFVDIHNHLIEYTDHTTMEQEYEAADYHLKNGTTSLLFTMYRDVPHNLLLCVLPKIKAMMQTHRQLLGVHMEGPYLNPKYGSTGLGAVSHIPDPAQYMELIASGLVKQWTFAPENENTDDFLTALTAAGIVPAIGHSAASPERVLEVCDRGVKIITHTFNATGSAIKPKGEGIKVVDFNAGAMLADDVFYEIICDKNQVHVPHLLIRLLIKTVGIEKLVAITDFISMPQTDADVMFVNGELSGSCMTMRQAAQNLSTVGLGLVDIFRATALNPARAIGVSDTVGSLRVGKRANIIVTDAAFKNVEVYLDGAIK